MIDSGERSWVAMLHVVERGSAECSVTLAHGPYSTQARINRGIDKKKQKVRRGTVHDRKLALANLIC